MTLLHVSLPRSVSLPGSVKTPPAQLSLRLHHRPPALVAEHYPLHLIVCARTEACSEVTVRLDLQPPDVRIGATIAASAGGRKAGARGHMVRAGAGSNTAGGADGGGGASMHGQYMDGLGTLRGGGGVGKMGCELNARYVREGASNEKEVGGGSHRHITILFGRWCWRASEPAGTQVSNRGTSLLLCQYTFPTPLPISSPTTALPTPPPIYPLPRVPAQASVSL